MARLTTSRILQDRQCSEFAPIEMRCGIYEDHVYGFQLITEKHIRESASKTIMARLPLAGRLANKLPGFRDVSPEDARRFVKGVKSGQVKHSVCTDICGWPELHDSELYSSRILTPQTVKEFMSRVQILAHAMIDVRAALVLQELTLEYEYVRDRGTYSDCIRSTTVGEFKRAERLLTWLPKGITFEEYINSDHANEIYVPGREWLDWAFAVILAAKGDSTALYPAGNFTGAISILARILRSCCHWRAVVRELELTSGRTIHDLTGCTVSQIESLRTYLLAQLEQLKAFFAPGNLVTYQQVRLAESYAKGGWVEAACSTFVEFNELTWFVPATDIITLRVDPHTHRWIDPGNPDTRSCTPPMNGEVGIWT